MQVPLFSFFFYFQPIFGIFTHFDAVFFCLWPLTPLDINLMAGICKEPTFSVSAVVSHKIKWNVHNTMHYTLKTTWEDIKMQWQWNIFRM